VRATEIEKGEYYVYGTKGRWGTYQRACILELGKHRVLEDSDAEVPAARIRLDDGTEDWVVLRSILMPWSEHAEEQARAEHAYESQAGRNSEKAERARNAIKGLTELGFDTGTQPFELMGETAVFSGFVRVKLEFLEDVLDALS
jgi:hypothetical protein